jgi:Family of unknown function (DUF6932)
MGIKDRYKLQMWGVDLSFVDIPTWNSSGVLPPNDRTDGVSFDRSPYNVTLTELVTKLGFSENRKKILTGLLEFREELHALGLTKGFQWIDGSFVEDVETTEKRPPNDVDVVTFFHIPDGENQRTLVHKNRDLFDQTKVKSRFFVDSYPLALTTSAPETLVGLATYWYSLWSHKRTGEWKGYLQIDLDPCSDRDAKLLLSLEKDNG